MDDVPGFQGAVTPRAARCVVRPCSHEKVQRSGLAGFGFGFGFDTTIAADTGRAEGITYSEDTQRSGSAPISDHELGNRGRFTLATLAAADLASSSQIIVINSGSDNSMPETTPSALGSEASAASAAGHTVGSFDRANLSSFDEMD